MIPLSLFLWPLAISLNWQRCFPSQNFINNCRMIESQKSLRSLSLDIRFQAACVASLKRSCTCCTQSRPVTSIRAMMSGSVSLLDSSNSFRACFCSFRFHGSPVFSSAQWKCLAVLKISRYNDKASLRRVRSVKCFAGVILWDGTQILGGIFNVESFDRSLCYAMMLFCIVFFVFVFVLHSRGPPIQKTHWCRYVFFFAMDSSSKKERTRGLGK